MLDPVYGYYVNEEEDQQLKPERKVLRSSLDPLPNQEFRKLFRLTKDVYQNLVGELTPHLQAGERSTKLSIDMRVLVALRFFATGSYQKGIGNEFHIAISQQSMSNIFKEVAEALEVLAPRYIKFPTEDEHKQAIQQEFMQKFGFPRVLGTVDGTHIAILQPLEDEHIYFNRKGFHSKNVQIICESNLTIINVNANFRGSAYDVFIWRNSAFCRHLEDYYQRGNPRLWLIGDSGYPLQPWLMTPITHTEEDIRLS
jgi:SpoU rRNA methylase family enzyme